MHELWLALILGIVEGLTEFLPVSSTGHLILVGEWLGFAGERAETFEIFIQLGAILAVLWLYRQRFWGLASEGVRGRAWWPRPGTGGFTLAHLALACAPAFVLGALLHSPIKAYLFSSRPVVAGLMAGGLLMVGAERWGGRRQGPEARTLDEVTLLQALAVGCVQCLALWPGFSRSGATISGGLLAGLDRRTATELSFVVAVPVMVAATLFDLVRSWQVLDAGFSLVLAVGTLVSFAVAWAAVLGFLRLVQHCSLVPFAVYRFALAAVLVLVLAR
ncbi:MAG TPA: undecaprenyl-diphosphate phosphatase [Thermoanaerobaculaceae bacterium]|nr:undecaprenyl-diphosphate phosphatase [Thermoanaerobaculaceae bacterium]HRS17223.1 undecaprenyl-diphosphate phosphatase [Thermoanaerobaculaceae bacterium]